MKNRKSNKVEEVQSSCCTSSVVEQKDVCCDQPIDESSCCDKTETKDVNIEKTGCC